MGLLCRDGVEDAVEALAGFAARVLDLAGQLLEAGVVQEERQLGQFAGLVRKLVAGAGRPT